MARRRSSQLSHCRNGGRARLVGKLVVLVLLSLPGAAVADLAIEEARQLAQEFAMYDLADASVREEDRDGERLAVFQVDDVARTVEYTVNLSRGRILGWRDWPLPSTGDATPATDAERVSAEQAIAIVKEVATRALGEDVNAMAWTTPSSAARGYEVSGARRYEVSGRRSAWGDPPRTSGLSEDVFARVSPSGRVESYRQLLPPEAPAEVAVTETEATEIALAGAVERGIPEDDAHVQYVRLVQRGSRAYPDIQVSDYAIGERPTSQPRSVIYEIGVQTGEIESAGQSASSGWRPVREAQADDDGASRRASAAGSKERRFVVAGVLGAVCALIGSLYWVARRRR